MPNKTEIADLTATELLAAYENRTLSPVEATEACLARIKRYNDVVNAYCFLDEETTLAAARRSEERWRRGIPLGLVDGVPVAIKDVFLTRGWPTLKASKLASREPGKVDAPAIAALRRHGMVPLGMTINPEFAWKGVTDSPLFGVTGNPWNPKMTAGGSSGGAAAAVPLGMGPLALGTDAGGSIRIPAGFSGLFGLKPTLGRAPMWPASAFAPLAHVGPMTWTVRDAALLMNVLCEPDARDATALPRDGVDYLAAIEGGVRGLHVAFSPNLGFAEVHPEIAAAVKKAAQVFTDLGAHVEETSPGFSDPLEPFERLFYAGAANAMRDIDDKRRKEMDPALVEVAQQAAQLSALDLLEAHNERLALSEKMSRFHQRYDLLLTPSLPIPAFEAGLEVPRNWKHRRWPTWTPFTYPFNMTGQPAASVPCGFTSDGLPIGLQVIGAFGNDALVMRASHAYQSAAPLTDRRPRPE